MNEPISAFFRWNHRISQEYFSKLFIEGRDFCPFNVMVSCQQTIHKIKAPLPVEPAGIGDSCFVGKCNLLNEGFESSRNSWTVHMIYAPEDINNFCQHFGRCFNT